jgi:glycerophosphoryl diester phosphodiesterase
VTPDAPRFRILGYRSSAWAYPPNTLPALRAALDEGADGLAVDVELTKDGVLVACEDRLLRAVSEAFRGTRDATYAQLAMLDAGVGFSPLHHRAPIPTIEGVLAAFASRCELVFLMPDDADEELAEALGQALSGGPGSLGVVSESVRLLSLVHRNAPKVRRILRVLDPWADNDVIIGMQRDIDGVAAPIRQITPDFALELAAAGVELVAEECETPTVTKRALHLAVDCVLTERPRWLRNCAQEQQRVVSRYPRPYAWRF